MDGSRSIGSDEMPAEFGSPISRILRAATAGLWVGILGALLLIPASTTSGQEIGILGTMGHSGDENLGDPSGRGLRFSWFPLRFLGTRFQYSTAGSSGRWMGMTCDAYWPEYSDCRDEVVRSVADFDFYDLILVVAPLRADGWRAEAWVGASKADFEYTIRGVETGRFLDRSYRDSPYHDGLIDYLKEFDESTWGVGVSREGLGDLPVVFGVEWNRRSRMESQCGTDSFCPSWYDGFRIQEVRAHLSWSFRPWQWGR